MERRSVSGGVRSGSGPGLGRALAAGGVATAAVTGAMKVARERGWTSLEFPRVLGTALGEDTPRARAAGWALFAGNGVLLAACYREAARLTGAQATAPRGAALGLLHGLVAAGFASLLSPLHPRPLQAGLGRWLDHRPPAASFAALVGVHVLYGGILGALAHRRVARG